MMRSLYSGVAGLRSHQTRMDVIGNNIANVNTVGYKSQSVTFSDVLYQTTQNASGPNETTERAVPTPSRSVLVQLFHPSVPILPKQVDIRQPTNRLTL